MKKKIDISWPQLGLTLAVTILFLGFMGSRSLNSAESGGFLERMFDLDRELNIVTLFAAGLLFGIGALLISLSRRGGLRRKWTVAVGGFFIFMGFDEFFKIHETLEKVTGIDWQILYLPLIGVAGIGWLYLFFRGDPVFRILWSAGAVCWVASQLLEAGQWGWWSANEARAENYDMLMISEELLEMTGSALFLLAVFRWLTAAGRKAASTRGETAEGRPEWA